jgi:cation:H+ antiporter
MIFVILLLALAGIVFGADWLVGGSVSIAKRLRVSEFVIGAAIVGIGTSMPELIVSTLGAVKGNSDVAIGNVVGSNIFNILGILGVTALICPIPIDRKNMKFEIPLCILVSALLLLLAMNFFNGTAPIIGRIDGFILLGLFVLFIWYSMYRDRKETATENTEKVDDIKLTMPIIKVIGGLGLLIYSCDLFVDKAVLIAKNMGLSDSFISITLIACGTSLPELAASAAAAFKKNTQLALGNIIGSNIFNITLILGVASQITPLTSSGITAIDYSVAIVSAGLIYILGFTSKINRLAGILMVGSFVAYTLYLLY